MRKQFTDSLRSPLADERTHKRLWTLYLLLLAVAVTGMVLSGSESRLSWQATLGIFAITSLIQFMDSTLGMGHGTVLTPVLMFLGFPPSQIVPSIFVSELVTGPIASGSLHALGVVDLKPGKPAFLGIVTLSACSLIGTVAAVLFSIHLPRTLLSYWIAGIVISVGTVILIRRNRPIAFSYPKLLVLGLLASFNKGLSGGGYGPLVTGGQLVAGLSPKDAVAITSFARSFTCLVGLGTYLAMGKPILAPVTLPVVVGALFALPWAIRTVKQTQERKLSVALGTGVIALGTLLACGVS